MRNAHVATEAEWKSLAETYGSSAELKYNSFANGGNVGAADGSKLSLMLGGAKNGSEGYLGLGEFAYFMTANDNGNGSKKASSIYNDNTYMPTVDFFTSDLRAPIRLVVEPKQN